MGNPTHLERSLQRDIDRIRTKILDMSARGEWALKTCLRALTENNRQSAYAVILRDQQIDELEKEIDRLCLEFLVRQQPVAGHLRFAYAAIKINAELERIGDYAESIARQVLKISQVKPTRTFARFGEIAELSIPMMHDAVRAFVDQNAELARATMPIEERVDAIRNGINSELMRDEESGDLPIDALTPLMTIARRYERVADQARNICEEVLYMCTGEYMKHKGAEATRILFVDLHNSCRSQMAEAIANSRSDPNLVFSSAGIDPQPVDSRAVQFLREKGLDISHQFSKSMEQVPNLDHYQVVIALNSEARRVFPPAPTKTVALDWSVRDPSAVRGSPEEVQAAYEETFQSIQNHIRDLVEAIIGTTNEPQETGNSHQI